MLVGLGHDQVKLPLNAIVVRELDVKGSFAYVDTVSTTVGTTVMFTVMYA